MVYTYIFAIYSAFIFVKTKSILICIILHAYCNFLGAPTGLGVLFRPKKLDREYVSNSFHIIITLKKLLTEILLSFNSKIHSLCWRSCSLYI